MNIHWTSKGNPKNPNVIFIHGLLGASRNLLRLITAVSDAGFFTVAYDQPGHGHSEHLRAEEYTLENLSNAINTVMKANSITKTHLVGHSLGARVAIAYAHTHPDNVLSLTLLDAGVQITSSGLQQLKAIINPLPEFFDEKKEAENYLKKHLKWLGTTQSQLQSFLMSNLRTVDGKQQWVFDLKGIQTTLIDALATNQMDAWKKIQCPCLVARGDRSDSLSEENFKLVVAANPHATGVTIPNSGHWLHVDNLEATIQALLKFLNNAQVKI